MPAHLPRDSKLTTGGPSLGREGSPSINWLAVEDIAGRMVDPNERRTIEWAVNLYALRMADAFHAPTVRDLLNAIDRILDAMTDQVALDQLIRTPTTDVALDHLRWQLFNAHKAPRGENPGLVGQLKEERRRLNEELALRDFHRTRQQFVVETSHSDPKVLTFMPGRSIAEIAFANLVRDLATFWEAWGRETSARKDEQKALNPRPSPFVAFVFELMFELPADYRRASNSALAKAIGQVLGTAKRPKYVSKKRVPTRRP